MRPRPALGLVLEHAAKLAAELAARMCVDDRPQRFAVEVFAAVADDVDTDAEVAERRLAVRAVRTVDGVVELDHLAQQLQTSTGQSSGGKERDGRVRAVALERAGAEEARRPPEIVEQATQ